MKFEIGKGWIHFPLSPLPQIHTHALTFFSRKKNKKQTVYFERASIYFISVKFKSECSKTETIIEHFDKQAKIIKKKKMITK